MREIMVLVKNTVRLLLRSKGFLFFLIVIPILSILVLDIHDYGEEDKAVNENETYLLSEMSERISYDVKAMQLPVKVYDSSQDECGRIFANDLAKAGIFQIFYCNTENETEKAIRSDIDRTVQMDRVNAIIYLTPEFVGELRKGEMIHGLTLFTSDADERNQALEQTVEQLIGGYMQVAAQVPEDMNLAESMQKADSMLPARKVVTSDTLDQSKLTYIQTQQMRRIGYFMSILTISFLFSGVLIADTVIKERQYKVYSRIQLSEVTPVQYVISKYIVCLVTVLLQIIVIAAGVSILLVRDYSISKVHLILIIGLMGIIFNTMSLCIGMLCNHVMNTNYIGFSIWSVTCLLSGCYFDLSDAGKTIKGISNLMPQKWGLECAAQIMLGNTSEYGTLLLVTVSFLLIIGTGAVIGTRHFMEG